MFGRFKQRSHELERLDTGDYTPEEYARWQGEMRVIHRVFGETRALGASLLKQLSADPAKHVRVLDVGAGSGGLLEAVWKRAAGQGLTLVGAELSAAATRSMKGLEHVTPVRCDALRLPFADDSFDYVFSTLFLHHLTDPDAVKLITEMSRVARRRFFVIDLHRHPLAYYFYKAAGSIWLQRFTREDGALSILRSFRPAELLALARNAGFDDAAVTRSAAYRLILSGTKRAV